jgi:hypothetical protein
MNKAVPGKQAAVRTARVTPTRTAKEAAAKEVASKKVAGKKSAKRATERPDIVIRSREGAETFAVEVKVKESSGEVIVTVIATEGDQRQPVSEELVRRGLELLFQRESRIERTAARYGLAAEALLASLEESAVDLTDESAGVPEAELDALREAGISLRGSPADPSGAAQVALGLARFQRFRDEALTAAEAARMLNVTDSRVRQLIASGEVVTIPNSDGHLLPAWQFAGGRLVPGLPELIEAIEDVHPLTLASFMTLPDVDLEVEGQPVSPVQWLLGGGDVESVTDLATGLGLPS